MNDVLAESTMSCWQAINAVQSAMNAVQSAMNAVQSAMNAVQSAMNDVLAWTAAAVVFVWGVSHLIPTRQVVAGFGEIGDDNRRIITMEWVAEGISFIFVAVLLAVVASSGSAPESAEDLVYRLSSGFLVAVGAWTALTGARTGVIWFKMCPVVMAVSSALLVTASFV